MSKWVYCTLTEMKNHIETEKEAENFKEEEKK